MDGQSLNFRIAGDDSAFRAAIADARKEAQALNRDVTTGFGGARNAGRGFVQAANDSAAGFRKMGGAAKLTSAQLLNLSQQGNDVITMMALGARPMQIFASQAGQIYDAVASGPGGLTGGLKGLGNGLLGVVTRFPLLTAATAVTAAGLLGMQHEINATSATTVSLGNVAVAVFNVIRDAIWSRIQPAFAAIAPWAQIAWNGVVGAVKGAGNLMIGIGVASVNGVIAAWRTFPAAIGDLAYQAADKFYAGITAMVRTARAEINGFIASINGTIAATGIQIPSIEGGGLAGLNKDGTQAHIANPYAGSASGAAATVKGAVDDAFSTDYLGEFYDAVKQQAVALAKAGDEGDKAGKKIGGGAKNATDAWKGLRKATDDTVQKMRDAAQTLGQSFGGQLKGLLDGTMKWKDALISAAQAALKYFDQVNIAQGGQGLFGGGLLGGLLHGLLGFARGGVFDSGVTRFAKGGAFSNSLLTQPTVFRFANGIGMAGEAGPEAIMPLRRGSDGRLGVAANTNQPSTVYAPVYNIDARGADRAAVTRLEQGLKERDRNFAKSVTAVIKTGQVRGGRP